mgnify:CR=1 FL=1
MSTADTILQTDIRAGYLTDTMSILRALGDEAILHLGNDGLNTKLVDPAKVAMYRDVSLSPAAFESTPSGSFALGINLERLQETLQKAGDDTTVSLSFDPKTRKLNVAYDRVSVDLACIDPDSIRSEPDVNEIDLPNHFAMQADELGDAVDIVDLVTDHITIEVTDDAVLFTGEGDSDDSRYELLAEELDQPDLPEDTVSLFSMEYFQSFLGGMPSDVATVSMHVGDEFPVLFNYEFADGDGYIEGMLAPRLKT